MDWVQFIKHIILAHYLEFSLMLMLPLCPIIVQFFNVTYLFWYKSSILPRTHSTSAGSLHLGSNSTFSAKIQILPLFTAINFCGSEYQEQRNQGSERGPASFDPRRTSPSYSSSRSLQHILFDIQLCSHYEQPWNVSDQLPCLGLCCYDSYVQCWTPNDHIQFLTSCIYATCSDDLFHQRDGWRHTIKDSSVMLPYYTSVYHNTRDTPSYNQHLPRCCIAPVLWLPRYLSFV